jgi:predicted permease
VRPLLGRPLTPADDRHGGGPSGPVAVISYAFWQSHYGGARDVLGKVLHLDRQPFEIVGVTPQWSTGLDIDNGYDAAIPIGCEPILHHDRSWLSARSTWWLRLLGRLPAGVSLQQAEAQLNSLAPEINRATVPSNWDEQGRKGYLSNTFPLRPASTGFSETRDQYKRALYTLMAVVAIVLLIACANIANLMLERGAARQREISIRLAIGAARPRLIRQLLTESLLLSLLGAAGGLLFARWGSGLLVRFFSTHRNPIELDLRPDLTVLAFTSAVAILTGLLFGLAPALRATRTAPNNALKENARGAVAGSSRFHPGKALVPVQVGLSLVLLVGAGLFLGTFRNLLTMGTGFSPERILVAQVDTLEKVPKNQRVALYQALLDSFRALPGVASGSGAVLTPIRGMQWNNEVFPQGYQAKSRSDNVVWFNRVSPGYFRTVRTPILAGRDFRDGDRLGSPRVMIIDESTARHFFGGLGAVGKTIGIDDDAEPRARESYEVVGVVRDAKYGSMREKDSRTVYLAMGQDPDPWPSFSFLLRASGSPSDLPPYVRTALAAINPGLSLEFRVYDSIIQESMVQERTVALLSAFFGGLALLLAMIGLYGVNAYSVARRQAEIGIRLALGASRGTVVWLVLRDVAILLVAGVALGVAAVLAAGRLVESLLFGVKPADPFTIGAAALLLATAAVLAAFLPARRASRLDPVRALREE